MTEEKGEYSAGREEADEQHEIRDEAPHDYFGTIPHIVDEMKLSPHAYRLYGRFKRVAGDSGKCWQSTKTLAEACQMSAGKISEAKYELENVYPPLVRIVSVKKDNLIYHEVYVTDIWALNHQHFTGNPVHMVNGEVARSQYERSRSHGETKKNPLREEEHIQPLSEKDTTEALDYTTAIIKNSLRKSKYPHREKFPEVLTAYADLYVELTGQEPQKSTLHDWLSTFSEWQGQGIGPEHIRAACKKLGDSGILVTRPGSLTKTAYALKSAPRARVEEQPRQKTELEKYLEKERLNGK